MPLTIHEHSRSLGQPPLCEQLKVRDIIDDLLIEVNGSFVAGYAVSGINSYYASDEERNRTKLSLEALVRSLPERSMRMQVRFEIAGGYWGPDSTPQPGAAEPKSRVAGAGPRTGGRLAEKRRRRFLPDAISSTSTSCGTQGSITNLQTLSGRRRCAAAVSAYQREVHRTRPSRARRSGGGARSLMSGVEATLQSTGMKLITNVGR